MGRTLDVYLHNELVGHLIQDDGGQMVFDYAESWFQKLGATPLSQSLPLRKERFKRNECRGFFAGILPEEGKREIIARNLGISARNDYAMLEQIGGECAGAITFIRLERTCPSVSTVIVRSLRKNSPRYRKNDQSVRCWPARTAFAFRLPAHRTKSPCASRATTFPCRSAAFQARTF